MNFEWREASFLHNSRLLLPTAPTVAHAFISGDVLRIRSLTGYETPEKSLFSRRFSNDASESHFKLFRESLYRLSTDSFLRWPQVWAALAFDPTIGHANKTWSKFGKLDNKEEGADLLFVRFDERNMTGNHREGLYESACFTQQAEEEPLKGGFGCRYHPDSYAKQGIPPLLLELRQRLRWCRILGSAAPRDKAKRPKGITPNDDCYTALERKIRLKEREEKLKLEDKRRREEQRKKTKRDTNIAQ